MRIRITAVGRARRTPVAELCAEYLRRIHRWPIEIREVEGRGSGGSEAKALYAAIPRRAQVIALDRQGDTLDSEGFARLFDGWAAASIGQLAFVVGGADGLSERLLSDSDHIISFGSMTWPHMLARLMLVEQIYRAQQILAGHPYHRE